MMICFIQSLDAQKKVNQSNNAVSHLDTLVSKWRQNSPSTFEDVTDAKRRRASKLLKLGILYVEDGEYLEARDCLKKAAELYFEINDEYYFSTLVWLCDTYHSLGSVDEYNSVKNEIRQVLDRDTITNNEIKLEVLSRYSEILKDEGYIEKALTIAEKAKNTALEIYGSSNPKIFGNLFRLCSYYLDKGELIKSKDLLEMIKTLNLESQVDKTDYYNSILLESYWMHTSGEIGEMIRLLEKMANEIEGINDFLEMRAQLCDALGNAYSSIGDFNKSQLYAEKTVEIKKILFGDDSPYYATALINLSELYYVNGLKDNALYMNIKALDIFEKLYGKNNEKYLKCLEKIASFYEYKNPQKSKEIFNECLMLSESLYGINSKEYAEILIFTNIDFSPDPSLTAISNVKKGIEILKSIGLTTYDFYPGFLNWYCFMLYNIKDYPNLYDASSELLEVIRNRIYHNFLIMPENQREIFWNLVKSNLEGIESYAAAYAQHAVEKNDFSLLNEYGGLAYNARLLKKGLLLNSSRSIENIISEKDDNEINRLIVEIKSQRNKLSTLKHGEDEYIQIERALNNIERELLVLISSYGDFMKFTNVKWQDIQDVLKPGEVALEFFSYKVQHHIQYGAIILSHNSDPLAFPLFCEDELSKFSKGDETTYDYDNPELYRTIWSVLENFSEIRDAETIYFSADNILNTIAIESLIDPDGYRANDKRKLFRLSSTREIVSQQRGSKSESSAILYGGLNYDAPLESYDDRLIATSNAAPSLKFKKQSHPRSSRGTYEYLPGTLVEVQNISTILQDMKSEILTGERGSEGSFIALNNVSPTIIHLATHGFFYEPEDIEDKLLEDPTKYSFLNLSNLDKVSIETQAMRGSGLLFSGANHTLKGLNIPDNIPDGVLTAEELSYLNLRQTELVVLSACETGLGTSTDEGVFGLQRGFKLAGVRSLLMSLWKVDDKATAKLMQQFYDNISKGLNKTQALHEAQKSIRNDSKTSQPYFWAGWILLDGLN